MINNSKLTIFFCLQLCYVCVWSHAAHKMDQSGAPTLDDRNMQLKTSDNKDMQVSDQKAAVAIIKKHGGTVGRDKEHPAQIVSVNFNQANELTDSDLVILKQLPHLRVLNLDKSQVTDAGLEHVKELSQLRSLSLKRTKVTDSGLERIQNLTLLQSLSLYETKISDAGLKHIAKLTKLQTLGLGATNITDAGLEHIRNLKQIKSAEFC